MLRVQVGAKLPRDVLDARITDAQNELSTLGTHVEGHATLLLFLRPFGCIGCNQQVGRILPRLRELDDAGVRVVLVGLGRPEHIAGFLERFGAESARLEVYTDTTGHAHRAAGLERSVRSTYGLRAIVGKLRALGAGYRGGRLEGDKLQQGGAILVDRNGVVTFYHRNPAIADLADEADIVDAALAAEARNAVAQGAFVL